MNKQGPPFFKTALSTLWRGLRKAARLARAAMRTNGGKAGASAGGLILIFGILFQLNALVPPPAPPEAPKPPERAADPAVARIGDTFLFRSDLERAARLNGDLEEGEGLTSGALAEDTRSQLVDERLLARAAEAAGLADDEDVKARLDAARNRILGSLYLDKEIGDIVTPEQLRAVYDQQSALLVLGDEVRARHILVGSEEEAQDVIALLQQDGADFAAIARERSLDPSTGPAGGEIGYFTAEMMAPPFSKAAFATAVGAIADPFETEFGWHILQVEDRRPAPTPPFSELRPEIERVITLTAVEDVMAELRRNTEVELYDLRPPAPGDALQSD